MLQNEIEIIPRIANNIMKKNRMINISTTGGSDCKICRVNLKEKVAE